MRKTKWGNYNKLNLEKVANNKYFGKLYNYIKLQTSYAWKASKAATKRGS